MRFITEMDLRDLYRTEPFTTYVLEPGTRITPGARQFLVDKRVTLVQAQCSEGNHSNPTESSPLQRKENWSVLRLRRRMDCIESLFLLVAAEILSLGDTVQSEEILALGKCFRDVRDAEREQKVPNNIQFWGWSEEEVKNRSDDLEKYPEINEFHVGLENGKVIVLLNHLRTSLREMEPAILETYWDEEKQVCLRQDLIDKINLMIHILCIIVRKCLGGKEWRP